MAETVVWSEFITLINTTWYEWLFSRYLQMRVTANHTERDRDSVGSAEAPSYRHYRRLSGISVLYITGLRFELFISMFVGLFCQSILGHDGGQSLDVRYKQNHKYWKLVGNYGEGYYFLLKTCRTSIMSNLVCNMQRHSTCFFFSFSGWIPGNKHMFLDYCYISDFLDTFKDVFSTTDVFLFYFFLN